jgi:hypothetical protein
MSKRLARLLLVCVLFVAGCGSSPTSPEQPEPDPPPPPPLFSQAGTGNNVITLPTYVQRLRITGAFTGFSSNFVIWCGTQLVVNELLGTGWGPTSYTGTHLIQSRGCILRIEDSTQVVWTLTEVR